MSRILIAVCIFLFAGCALGQSESNGVFTPPVRHPESRYSVIWRNSPFELEAAPQEVVEQTKEVPVNDYFLAGVIKKGAQYVAYVQNRKTNAVVKVTEEPNPSGFVLKEVSHGESPGEFIAKVEKQGKPLTLSYDRKTVASTPRSSSPTSTASPPSSKTGGTYNPAKLALERARQKAAEAKARAAARGNTEGEKANSRKRTIFVPK